MKNDKVKKNKNEQPGRSRSYTADREARHGDEPYTSSHTEPSIVEHSQNLNYEASFNPEACPQPAFAIARTPISTPAPTTTTVFSSSSNRQPFYVTHANQKEGEQFQKPIFDLDSPTQCSSTFYERRPERRNLEFDINSGVNNDGIEKESGYSGSHSDISGK